MYVEIWKPGETPNVEGYTEFKDALMKASFHYADDRGGEWGLAKEEVRKAAGIAAEAKWPFWALDRMFREMNSLVTFGDFMQQYINYLNSKIG